MIEQDATLKQRLFKLFSTNLSPEGQASYLSELLCCLPQIAAEGLNYENVFRVLVVQFMDAHNLDIRALKKSCVHMARPDGKMIPFEAFNLFYRGNRSIATSEIRAEIAAWTEKRKISVKRPAQTPSPSPRNK